MAKRSKIEKITEESVQIHIIMLENALNKRLLILL